MKFKRWIILENKQEYINQSKNILKKLGIHEVDSAVQEIEQFVKNLDCSNKKQFVPVVALFYNHKPLIFGITKRLSEIINNNKKIDVRYDKNKQEYYVFVHSTQESFYNRDFIKFMEWVDGEYYAREYERLQKQAKSENTDFSDMKKIASSNNIDVYEVRNVFDAIKLGRGYSFCISQPGANNAYYTYRMHRESTFYFVFDRNRDRSDPLHVVVVDISIDYYDDEYDDDYNDYYNRNYEYITELTDAKNTTGIIDHPYHPGQRGRYHEEYFSYLRDNGINIRIFKHKPLTDEERKDYEIIGEKKESLQEFKDLPVEYKTKYIKLHQLTPEQLEYIIDEAIKGKSAYRFMLEFYLDTGHSLPDYILYNLYNLTYNQRKGKKQWLKTYLRKINMFDEGYNWFEIILLDKIYGKTNIKDQEYLFAINDVSPQLENSPEYRKYVEEYAVPVLLRKPEIIHMLYLPTIKRILKLNIDKEVIVHCILRQWIMIGNSVFSSEIVYFLEHLFKNNREKLYKHIDNFFSSISGNIGYEHIAKRYEELISNKPLSNELIKAIGEIINKHIDQRKAIQSNTAVFSIDLMIRTERFDLFDVIPAFLPENKRDIDNLGYSVSTWANYISKKQKYYMRNHGKQITIELESSSRVNKIIKNHDKIFDKNINTWSEILHAINPESNIEQKLIDFHDTYSSARFIYNKKNNELKQRLKEFFRNENNPKLIKSHILFIIEHFFANNDEHYYLVKYSSNYNDFLDYFYAIKEVYPTIVFESEEISEKFVIFALIVLDFLETQLGKWLLDRTNDNILIYDIKTFTKKMTGFDNYMEYAKKILHTFETGTGAKFFKKYHPPESVKSDFLQFIKILYEEVWANDDEAQHILHYFLNEMPIGRTHMWFIDDLSKSLQCDIRLIQGIDFMLNKRTLSYFLSRGKYQEWESICKKMLEVLQTCNDRRYNNLILKYNNIKQK